MTSVQDRYARSISSSHLEVTEYVGDIDALIAAGWVKEGLATMLWRLRVEYDKVDKQSLRRANCTMTDRLLALAHMKSLPAARDALGRFTMAQSTRLKSGLTGEQDLRVAGRALNSFLDPQCPACHGVKFKTVPGSGRLSAMPCGACEGSGKAQLKFDDLTAAEFALQQSVLAEIDRKLDRVARLMRQFTKEKGAVAGCKEWLAEQAKGAA